ncbi:MAG: YbaB/EbfC family nucleoid-associated protein [Rickettsiaceae bacterium]|nr:YbaB/EbfC family nucleoid-associated protein [Rickettsiaceae bacterium]
MDINQLMKQAQNMQKKMSEMQKEIAGKSYEGKSGGGLISIIMSGDGKMNKVNIDVSLLQESEKEMLEDLIVAAHNDAKNKAEADSKNRMGETFGNLGPLAQGLKF